MRACVHACVRACFLVCSVSDWTEKDVDKWLLTFGQLEHMLYSEVFAENAVTGKNGKEKRVERRVNRTVVEVQLKRPEWWSNYSRVEKSIN